jgi:hypothetical protein
MSGLLADGGRGECPFHGRGTASAPELRVLDCARTATALLLLGDWNLSVARKVLEAVGLGAQPLPAARVAAFIGWLHVS